MYLYLDGTYSIMIVYRYYDNDDIHYISIEHYLYCWLQQNICAVRWAAAPSISIEFVLSMKFQAEWVIKKIWWRWEWWRKCSDGVASDELFRWEAGGEGRTQTRDSFLPLYSNSSKLEGLILRGRVLPYTHICLTLSGEWLYVDINEY